MNKPRTGLGKGLSALIPSVAPGVETQEVDVDLIVPNPQQPRTAMNPDALAELAESIRQHGIIQPVLVSRLPNPQRGAPVYQLIAGERRLEAAKIAGLVRVPVVVKEATSLEQLELALVENLQRADLTPLEEAHAYKRLVDDFGLTQEGVAQRVAKSRTAVTNSLRLLNLSEEVRNSLAQGEITEGHARALLGLRDESEQRRCCRIVVENGLSVRETEELVRRWPPQPAAAARPARKESPEVKAVENRLRQALGTKVTLMKGRRGGHITIRFYSDEQLEAVVTTITGKA